METLPVVNSNTNFEDIAKLIGQEEPSSPARNMFFLKIKTKWAFNKIVPFRST